MENLLTTKQVAQRFQVKPVTVTQKFIPEGLPFIPIGKRDYRFNEKDVEMFAETRKKIAMEKQKLQLIKPKRKNITASIDFQKMEYNRKFNKVV